MNQEFNKKTRKRELLIPTRSMRLESLSTGFVFCFLFGLSRELLNVAREIYIFVASRFTQRASTESFFYVFVVSRPLSLMIRG
ncbi:hypothetical protein L873DRAFT_1819099, partial [Choiromyces venosus 120613-1]